MQAHAAEKQENLDEQDRIKPKVVSHMENKLKLKKAAEGNEISIKEKIQKTIEINLKGFKGGSGGGNMGGRNAHHAVGNDSIDQE